MAKVRRKHPPLLPDSHEDFWDNMICPHCGTSNRVHRSHSRGPLETFFKTVTPYKIYRCHDCNWRGWLRPSADGRSLAQGSWRTVFVVFVTGLLLGLLFATYVVYRGSGP